MKFRTKYGYFTDDGREYVITDYRTPKPWVNVISNGNYGLVVSQLGGGFSWVWHANLNRLTRWQQDLIKDEWGKYIYIRDDDTGEYWSPTFKPVMKAPDEYECRHGIGYTKFHSLYQEVETNIRIFVPFDTLYEVWTLEIINRGKSVRNLSIFTYFEWCLGAAPDSHREFHKTFIETEFDHENNVLCARKRLWEIPSERGHWNAEWKWTAFFSSSETIDKFEGDKEAFIGKYGSLIDPLALKVGKFQGKTGKWNDSICALKKSLKLSPREKKTIHFFLGIKGANEKINFVNNPQWQSERVEHLFSEAKDRWDEYLLKTIVETPDDALNFMTNYWLKYQSISGRLWGRAAYYQQSGAFGFRDQLQDSQIYLYLKPELTGKQILEHARHQFEDGRVLHWWHPITDEGNDARMSDDLLWLPFMTIQYLKETDDWAILEEKVPYYGSSKQDTLLDHCLRAIDRVLNHSSKRGLPLILAGDWNDGLSGVGLDGKGESVWLGHFLYYILKEIINILELKGANSLSENYLQKATSLKEALNQFGWDGEWYWRASKDNGELIGSNRNKQGKIFLNAQTWAVIADTANAERREKVMRKVEEMLECEVGMLLLHPAYATPDPFVGYLSRYAPGVRENGGVYTHAAVWSIWAECLLKNKNAAFRIYKKLCPIYNGQNPDRYNAEPYVTPGNIDGPDSPYYGKGGWTWYTGSAAWLFKITIDYLIGIRADYQGLVVDPCLPEEWNEIKIKRFFRGTNYHITIRRDKEISDGEKEIYVDGEQIEGDIIPSVINKEEAEVMIKISRST